MTLLLGGVGRLGLSCFNEQAVTLLDGKYISHQLESKVLNNKIDIFTCIIFRKNIHFFTIDPLKN